jgi:hypothetical protein
MGAAHSDPDLTASLTVLINAIVEVVSGLINRRGK